MTYLELVNDVLVRLREQQLLLFPKHLIHH
jgi:hypothetical protein